MSQNSNAVSCVVFFLSFFHLLSSSVIDLHQPTPTIFSLAIPRWLLVPEIFSKRFRSFFLNSTLDLLLRECNSSLSTRSSNTPFHITFHTERPSNSSLSPFFFALPVILSSKLSETSIKDSFLELSSQEGKRWIGLEFVSIIIFNEKYFPITIISSLSHLGRKTWFSPTLPTRLKSYEGKTSFCHPSFYFPLHTELLLPCFPPFDSKWDFVLFLFKNTGYPF